MIPCHWHTTLDIIIDIVIPPPPPRRWGHLRPLRGWGTQRHDTRLPTFVTLPSGNSASTRNLCLLLSFLGNALTNTFLIIESVSDIDRLRAKSLLIFDAAGGDLVVDVQGTDPRRPVAPRSGPGILLKTRLASLQNYVLPWCKSMKLSVIFYTILLSLSFYNLCSIGVVKSNLCSSKCKQYRRSSCAFPLKNLRSAATSHVCEIDDYHWSRCGSTISRLVALNGLVDLQTFNFASSVVFCVIYELYWIENK